MREGYKVHVSRDMFVIAGIAASRSNSAGIRSAVFDFTLWNTGASGGRETTGFEPLQERETKGYEPSSSARVAL